MELIQEYGKDAEESERMLEKFVHNRGEGYVGSAMFKVWAN